MNKKQEYVTPAIRKITLNPEEIFLASRTTNFTIYDPWAGLGEEEW